jgi:hypothetical protein
MPTRTAISPAAKVRLPHQFLELEVGPDRAEYAERHRDEEDVTPADRAEHAAEDEADERAGDPGDLVETEREAALVGAERVGEDRA